MLHRFVNSFTVRSRRLRKEYTEHFARFYGNALLENQAHYLLSAEAAPIAVIKESIEQQGGMGAAIYRHPNNKAE